MTGPKPGAARRRLASGAVAALVVLVGSACTGGGDGERATRVERTGNTELAVDVTTAGLTAEPKAVFEGRRNARCVAEEVVERFGVARLEELGLDLVTRTGPTLEVPGLTEPERHDVGAAYRGCVDAEGPYVKGLIANGLSRVEAHCVWASYEATGIAEVHLTEAPHGVSTVDTETARTSLDTFLDAAEAACRDWR